MMEGPGAESEEKHEPASDIDTAVADSLKALDPKWPIREAGMLDTVGMSQRCQLADSCTAANIMVSQSPWRRGREAREGCGRQSPAQPWRSKSEATRFADRPEGPTGLAPSEYRSHTPLHADRS